MGKKLKQLTLEEALDTLSEEQQEAIMAMQVTKVIVDANFGDKANGELYLGMFDILFGSDIADEDDADND